MSQCVCGRLRMSLCAALACSLTVILISSAYKSVPEEEEEVIYARPEHFETTPRKSNASMGLFYCPPVESIRSQECAPFFAIIGGMKCGTTSFFTMLVRHPEIHSPKHKELHSFDELPTVHSDDLYNASSIAKLESRFRASKGMRVAMWRRYLSRFPIITNATQAKRLRITGEATPTNLFFAHVPFYMHAFFPKTRILVLLRDPARRAVSHYYHFKDRKIDYRDGVFAAQRMSLETKIARDIRNIEQCWPRAAQEDPNDTTQFIDWFPCYQASNKNWRWDSVVARGLYHSQLMHWQLTFPPEHMMVINSEEFYKDHAPIMHKVTEFLHLQPFDWDATDMVKMNTQAAGKPVKEDTLSHLSTYFRPHNERLYKLLGRRYDW